MRASNTVHKALELLFYLHKRGRSEGVTAIAEKMGMPKSSVHRQLSALVDHGLVEQDDRGMYRPGFALVALGLGVLEREPLVTLSRAPLEEAVNKLGETCFLIGSRAGQLVVMDKVEGRGMLRASPEVGSVVPIHATAVGKLFMAYAPHSIKIDEELPSYTEKTVTNRGKLNESVYQIKRVGWAANIDEWKTGLSVVAAPVWQNQRMVGAVAIAVVTTRLHEIGQAALQQTVNAAAESVSQRFLTS